MQFHRYIFYNMPFLIFKVGFLDLQFFNTCFHALPGFSSLGKPIILLLSLLFPPIIFHIFLKLFNILNLLFIFIFLKIFQPLFPFKHVCVFVCRYEYTFICSYIPFALAFICALNFFFTMFLLSFKTHL